MSFGATLCGSYAELQLCRSLLLSHFAQSEQAKLQVLYSFITNYYYAYCTSYFNRESLFKGIPWPVCHFVTFFVCIFSIHLIWWLWDVIFKFNSVFPIPALFPLPCSLLLSTVKAPWASKPGRPCCYVPPFQPETNPWPSS